MHSASSEVRAARVARRGRVHGQPTLAFAAAAVDRGQEGRIEEASGGVAHDDYPAARQQFAGTQRSDAAAVAVTVATDANPGPGSGAPARWMGARCPQCLLLAGPHRPAAAVEQCGGALEASAHRWRESTYVASAWVCSCVTGR
eukprot:1486212-Prymnesium_polylepis.1